ncbi:hypothetical protein GC173_00620 [bacterium]|nr:hypothetical protein [bacterium]
MMPFHPVLRRTSDRDVPRELAQAVVRAGLGPVFHDAGNVTLASAPLRVAMIGTREPGERSLACMEALAGSLARAGAVIVSGAARGIDHACHRGALDVGGSTIAVLPMGLAAGGLDRMHTLTERLSNDRLLLMVSPFGMSQPITRSTPVIRNRLIAGLSHAVVVGEAGAHSGTFHCVRQARELGLPIFLLRDRRIARDGDLEQVHGALLQAGAIAFESDQCWDDALSARIVAEARASEERRLAGERAQLSLFGELAE